MPISFTGWVRESRENFQNDWHIAIMQAIYTIYLGVWFTITSRYDPGKNVLDHDWDLLLILDACRVDALREVQDEYEWLAETEVDSQISVASGSFEFMVKTFTTNRLDTISGIRYISANGFVERAFVDHDYAPNVSLPFGWPRGNVATEADFAGIDMLWKFRHEDRYNCVPPYAPTEEAIVAGREDAPQRCIVHYAQPHEPYPARAINEDRSVTDIEAAPLKALKDGRISRDEAWQLYLDNLRGVLDEVEVLLNNYDAEKVLITADHGESFGELGVHGHPTGWIHPVVKKVPWVWTSAEDMGETEPDLSQESTGETNLEEHLEALGYKT